MRPVRKKPVEYIVVHCSATKPSMDLGSSDIDTMHKARGWQGIGYHLVIRRNGKVEVGEDLKRRGAHAKGYNDQSVSVCLIGGISESGESEMNFTEAQINTLEDTLKFLQLAYPGAECVGHRDLSPDRNGDGEVDRHEWVKDCPCLDVGMLLDSGLAVFAAGGGAPDVEPEILEPVAEIEEEADEEEEESLLDSTFYADEDPSQDEEDEGDWVD